MADQRTQHSAVLVPILAGLAGAGIALLFAPRSGRETRMKIQETADELKHQARDGIDTAKSRVAAGVDQAREMKDRVGSAIQTSGRKSKHNIDELNDNTQREGNQVSPVLTSWDQEV